jgi:hypothetical protein
VARGLESERTMTARLFLGLTSAEILIVLGAIWYELRHSGENKP